MGREIENIRTFDDVVFAGGRSGTLGEFAIAYDEGKVIGVLCGTDAIIVYDADPESLLDELEPIYAERILPLHLDIIEGHNPDGMRDPNEASTSGNRPARPAHSASFSALYLLARRRSAREGGTSTGHTDSARQSSPSFKSRRSVRYTSRAGSTAAFTSFSCIHICTAR